LNEAGFFLGARAMATKELAAQVIENLRDTPFVLALLVINIIVLAGFAFTLHEVGNAIERRDAIVKACVEKAR
jgi:hypothetical protein